MGNKNINIAKNTIFLYIRMIFITVVSLYTSRVVLKTLGTNNYGIYQTVGGIVGVLSFLNSALSTGSSRFLTYELGKEKDRNVKKVFSSLFAAHAVLAAIIVLIGEPIGLWYIQNRLNIDSSLINTAKIIYQFSLLTTFVSITQVPYTSVIIAHENMKVYAYVSLIEVTLKLLISFLISFVDSNKLIYYAAFLCLSQVSINVIYRLYCKKKYDESRFDINEFDGGLLKEVFAFSSWSMFSSVSSSMIRNGSVVLLTQFFSPALAASRSLTEQVSNSVKQFINNFRTAVNPQVIKRYAAGEHSSSMELLLKSTYLSYYLMLFISLPVILLAEPLLKFWLGQIPDYAVIFLKWTMIQGLFEVFDSSFYVPLYAKGRLRENAILGPGIDLIFLFLVYLGFKNGLSPKIICYSFTAMALIEGLLEKPFLIIRYVNYRAKDIFQIVIRCLIVTLVAVPIPLFFSKQIDIFTIYNFLLICVISSVCNLISIWFLGLEKTDRGYLLSFVKEFINRRS